MIPAEAADAQQPALPRGRTTLFRDGFMFACSGMVSNTTRHLGSLLIATTDVDFEIESGGRRERCGVVAVRPMVSKQILANKVPFACLDIGVANRMFRIFSKLPDPGFLALPREPFVGVTRALRRFHDETMSVKESRLTFSRALDLAALLLPEQKPLDARIVRILTLLEDNPNQSAEQLAETVCLSTDRLSHLFSSEVRVSLRKYMQSLKLRAAACYFGSGMTMTQIAAAAGFSDSAHFSKVWARTYGTSPAHFFISGAMSVDPVSDSLPPAMAA